MMLNYEAMGIKTEKEKWQQQDNPKCGWENDDLYCTKDGIGYIKGYGEDFCQEHIFSALNDIAYINGPYDPITIVFYYGIGNKHE